MDLEAAQAHYSSSVTSQESQSTSEESAWSDLLASPVYTLAAGMLCGVLVNLFSRYMPRTVPTRRLSVPLSSKTGVSLVSRVVKSVFGDYKMVLVVRTDLGMGKGKAAAQCAHAALGCYKKAARSQGEALAAWERTGQTKVCVKTDSEASLLDLAARCRDLGITWSVVRDAGRTQVESGSLTVLGVGPAEAGKVDLVTGNLKLY